MMDLCSIYAVLSMTGLRAALASFTVFKKKNQLHSSKTSQKRNLSRVFKLRYKPFLKYLRLPAGTDQFVSILVVCVNSLVVLGESGGMLVEDGSLAEAVH